MKSSPVARRILALIGVLLGASLLLAGCTTPSGGAGGDQPVILNVGATTEPTGLDPATTTGAGTPFALLYNVYETLVRINDQGEIKPLLARSWEVSPDGMTYTFTLEPGARFASGSPVDAKAVIASFERTRDGAQTTGVLKSQMARIAEMREIDSHQVGITLTEPSHQWLYDITQAAGIVYDLGASTDLNATPAGSGPYVFVSHEVGSSIALKRNDKYWGTGPRVDEVNFRYYSDANAMVTAMLSGQLDIVSNLTVPTALDQFSDTSRYNLLEGTTNGEVVLGMNQANPALADVRVRQAINYAIDRKAVMDGAWGGKGTLIGSMVPPTDPWYEDLSKTYPYDPEKAKALLAEAGQAAGLKLRLRVPTLPYGPPISQIVTAQLRDVGIEVQVEELEFANWIESVYRQKDYDLTVVAHVEPWDLAAFANPDYYWNYKNDQFTSLLKQADLGTSTDERNATLKQAAKLLADDAAADWLFLLPNIVITTTEVSGVAANTTGLSFDLTHVATSR